MKYKEEIDKLNNEVASLRHELETQRDSLKEDLDLALRSIESSSELQLKEKDEEIARLRAELIDRMKPPKENKVDEANEDVQKEMLAGVIIPGLTSTNTSICNYLSLYQMNDHNAALSDQLNTENLLADIIPQIGMKSNKSTTHCLNEANEEIIRQLKETINEKDSFIRDLQNGIELIKRDYDKDINEFQTKYFDLKKGLVAKP